MATSIPPSTWENGFRQPATKTEAPWLWKSDDGEQSEADDDDPDAFLAPPSKELVTSSAHNSRGINVIRTWPTLFDGTNNPHGTPSWWKPVEEVDVLIVGAGPSGLEMAVSLARQRVSFRIIDKADSPLIAGRADGVQPRFLETVATWGLASEVAEEGPLIERTAIYLNGEKLLFGRSHQSDSRYRGLHIITQGQIERIYIRDLARHKALVERSSVLLPNYTVSTGEDAGDHPVSATIRNERTGKDSTVRAKFIVGCDGAASTVRKGLNIPFDGVSTDIYWGIMDCIFESDYPHAWVFGSVISSKHGGCVIIPREDGLYTQLDTSHTGPIATSRQAKDASFAESGGRVEIDTITPEEVLEQANKIFAPYKLKFAAPLSWFAIWKISERVARYYSSPDMRVHLVGDAAHVHSVMGAFGLNASIMDAANLAWKLGLAVHNKAKPETILPTYGMERRGHAVRIIEVSGTYLRFITGSHMPVPNLRDLDALNADNHASDSRVVPVSSSDAPPEQTEKTNGSTPKTPQEEGMGFVKSFFQAHGQFLLGVDCAYNPSVLAPADDELSKDTRPPLNVHNGVRAPNPRVCLSTNATGYLYDLFAGKPRFHLVVFASSLAGAEVRRRVAVFAAALDDPKGFYRRLGESERFTVTVVVKCLPFEIDEVLGASQFDGLRNAQANVVFDDRAPDEDAHTTWGANHAKGGVVVIRPDLWVGFTAFPDEVGRVGAYFDAFLQG
ncbi:FAD binding domain-containing protein [Bombardia bombarda]|uniref:FAD binding domain-containing protein n=1 Tax=Bombardia bombarda TaxID=252184 RepID=A0AA40BVJ5_9PEZI|nr:FAD binding domain-containing protein [Bombardia bombarda]